MVVMVVEEVMGMIKEPKLSLLALFVKLTHAFISAGMVDFGYNTKPL